MSLSLLRSKWRPAVALLAALWLSTFAARAQEPGSVEMNGPAKPIHTSTIAPDAPLPRIDITAEHESGSPDQGDFSAAGNVVVIGGQEFVLHADSLAITGPDESITASGHIQAREIDMSVGADRLAVEPKDQSALIEDATVGFAPYILRASRIALRDGQLHAQGAEVSTCPFDKHQLFHVAADRIDVTAKNHRLIVHNAKFYVFGTRIVTIKKITHTPSPSGEESKTQEGIKVSGGYNGYRGPFLILGSGLHVGKLPIGVDELLPEKGKCSYAAMTSATISLAKRHGADTATEANAPPPLVGLVRSLASDPGRPLPAGDPLLFHDYLGGDPLESLFNHPVSPQVQPVAVASYYEPLYGKRVGNLSYSRLPEFSAELDLPLWGNANLPTDRDPRDVRRALRTACWFASATVCQGYYQEQPTGAKSGRSALGLTIGARPILIADNTLFRPTVSYFNADYTYGRDHLDYNQLSLAVQRSFSEQSAVGAQYIGTKQHGTDPFVFDSVDTNQELDLNAQAGGAGSIVGGRLKFDLIRRDFYDWQLVYACPQPGYVPAVTYDHLSELLSLEFTLSGLDF
jgi:hypothetical protein